MSLTIIEQNNMVELEATIKTNLNAFYEVGFALMQIRDNKLYRENFTTFEAYCKEKWGMERNYANKLIRSSEVVHNLSTIVPKPINEAQARPLTSLPPNQQREVYQKALESAPEGKLTAKHIEEVVRGARQKEVVEEDKLKLTTICAVSDAMTFAGMAISQLERMRADDPLRKEGIQKVVDWCCKNLN